MARFPRLSKTLVAAAFAVAFASGVPAAVSAGGYRDHGYRHGWWFPLPPPPPFFFPRVVVHRHGPYCGHGYYDRYDRYDRHDRYDRYRDYRRERNDRHERHERW
jgi:hypothetical protein